MANTTWNPSDKSANITLSGTNNLTATSTTTAIGGVRAIDRQITGKYYWEITCTTWGSNEGIGFATAAASLVIGGPGNWVLATTGHWWIENVDNGAGTSIGTITSGSVVCFALDVTNGLFWARLGAAGNWNGSATNNPATGVGGLSSTHFGASSGFAVYPIMWIGTVSGHTGTANFGDSAFTGTVPSGFTSGFTSGATGTTNVIDTQMALEQWGGGTTNRAQLTQVALETWASATFGPVQAAMTQIGLEQWASVAFGTPGGAAQARAIILA